MHPGLWTQEKVYLSILLNHCLLLHSCHFDNGFLGIFSEQVVDKQTKSFNTNSQRKLGDKYFAKSTAQYSEPAFSAEK